MRVQRNQQLVRIEFDGWEEFVAYAEQDSEITGHTLHSREKKQATTGANATFTEAIELAREGWKEGEDKARKYSSALFNKLSQKVERIDPIADVEGAGFDIATMLSGVPEHWLRFETTMVEGHGKIIRILYACSVSAAVAPSVMIRRGAAVAALIELLEFAGVRCELIALPQSCGTRPSGGRQHEYLVTVKTADQPLDLGRVIFALAHPAMCRRLGFSLLELEPEGYREPIHGQYYGYPSAPSADLRASADIVIGSVRSDLDPWCRSEEDTEQFILDTLKKQGVEISEDNSED